MRFLLFSIFLFIALLGGCSTQVSARGKPDPAALPDLGEAPELTNNIWFNTPKPIRIKELHGKVVIVEMWTYGCVNCRNVIPSLRDWHEEYSDEGLVIIGNHYPEFDYESDFHNLKKAIQKLNIPYPVAEDNHGDTWKAYKTRFWPTLYLIDKKGHLRYVHIGEGGYDETEAAILALLAESTT